MSTLTIDVVTDSTKAVAALDGVADAAREVGDTVQKSSQQVSEGAGRMDAAAASADGLASTSSTLTGAFGALGSGLSLVGLDEYAAGLESAAMATDFFSGVGDLAALAMESQAVKTALSTAANVAHSVASGAASAATGVMTAAQWALNAALSANPVGLIVIAVVALIAGLILAYKNSETFREIVSNAMDVVKAGIDRVVDGVSSFVGWLKGLPDAARDAWGKVSGAVGDNVDKAKEWFGDLIADVKEKPGQAVATVRDAFSDMFQPIRDAIDWVQDLVAKLSNVKLPDLNPFNGRSGDTSAITLGPTPGTPPTSVAPPAPPVMNVYVTVNQTVGDPVAAAAEIKSILDRGARIL